VSDPAVLAAIELHDECWWLWHIRDSAGVSARMDAVVHHIPDQQLYLRFVELDQHAPGKDPRPLRWFCEEVRRRRRDPGS
jgi:hypothetical protein